MFEFFEILTFSATLELESMCEWKITIIFKLLVLSQIKYDEYERIILYKNYQSICITCFMCDILQLEPRSLLWKPEVID